jgi:hypothetical protein
MWDDDQAKTSIGATWQHLDCRGGNGVDDPTPRLRTIAENTSDHSDERKTILPSQLRYGSRSAHGSYEIRTRIWPGASRTKPTLRTWPEITWRIELPMKQQPCENTGSLHWGWLQLRH